MDDDATRASNAAATLDRRLLLEKLMNIRSMLPAEEGDAADYNRAMEGMAFNIDQLTAASRGFILTALLDALLLLLRDSDRDEGRAVASDADQQLMDSAVAAKKKRKRASAAAAKKKRNKRNKAAAKHNKTKLMLSMSWIGGGLISVIAMVAFSSMTAVVVPFSLIHHSDGSGEGEAPPALPPSASRSLPKKDIRIRSNYVESPSPNIISPLPAVAVAVVRPPVFSPSRRRMEADSDNTANLTTCLDTPNWKDSKSDGCDWWEDNDEPGCPEEYGGDMGKAALNCFYCGGGSYTLPPTTSPTFTGSPITSSAAPSSSPTLCIDSESSRGNWYDHRGYDCKWYEAMDVQGCPRYGYLYEGKKPHWGLAIDHCCHCHNIIVSTPASLSINAPSLSSTVCVDTSGWENRLSYGCDWYERENEPGCPQDGNSYWYECDETGCTQGRNSLGEMGSAIEHCCYCGGGSHTAIPVCEEAASCSCEDTVHIITNRYDYDNETFGLYNACKCDFWSRLCEDSGVGEACDYAAEYCCGDYLHGESVEGSYYLDSYRIGFNYLNSPTCYCDFFNYAQNEFGHTLKSKALNISNEFSNPCGQLEDAWFVSLNIGPYESYTNSDLNHNDVLKRPEFERPSLEAIYKGTNGQNWKVNDGWMNETDHCQWYGISCDNDGLVKSINLRDNNLAGQFPVYSHKVLERGENLIIGNVWLHTKYGLANLYSLKTLDLADNKLTGTIDYRPLYNLPSLSHFDVSANQLSGEMDALIAPSLTHADFSNNHFTSIRRFEKYKGSLQTLRFCDVSNNFIQIDATDLLKNAPPNIEQFFASNNKIHGSLPELLNNLPKLRRFNMSSNALSGSLPEWFNNLPALRQFDMSSNTLSGELPDFADSILSMQELDLSNQKNGFTGSIPEDLWRLQSLKVLNLAGNTLAGTISPDIGKMAALEVFDLSNNLLSSSIPSELGMLEGTLKRLRLANNNLSGTIPSQLGQLQGAFIILEGNHFHNKTSAPLSLCMLRSVEAFDIANDTTFCQIERNALSDFYDSAKGAEWTDGSLWLDEYASYCAWNGVTCDEEMNHVKKLQLSNNGLSGRLSERIGDLAFIEVLDLSDNDIKGSIPTEISLLSDLTYLRLSYNAFTGTAEGVGKLTKLQLLQLQSNRITEMPNMTQLQLDDKKYGNSTFVTDCGVPSAFDEAPKGKNCTMCCNANDDCYPQEVTPFEKMGLSYITFPAVFFVSFIVICCMVGLSLYLVGKRKNRGNDDLTMSAERRLEEDDNYALSRIGKDSVYSYFVTDMVYGWIVAFATLGIQVGILAVFIKASEAKLQEDTIDIQFTWKCPRDSDVCKNTADLTDAAWFIFSMLMVAFLAKDMINGSKLLYHSSESRHNLGPRIRYFIGGMCLCSITLFALYVSTVYNKAIATSNTDIIVNSVIVLFIMEIDEYIFAALEASNKKWTAHTDESEDSSLVTEVSEMKEEFELQRAQIESQQEQIDNQQEQINDQQKELRMLREMVEKIQQSQAAAAAAAAAATTTTTTTPESESAGVACEGSTNVQVQQMEQVDQIAMPCEAEENTQESKEADEVAATSDLICERDTDEALQE